MSGALLTPCRCTHDCWIIGSLGMAPRSAEEARKRCRRLSNALDEDRVREIAREEIANA